MLENLKNKMAAHRVALNSISGLLIWIGMLTSDIGLAAAIVFAIAGAAGALSQLADPDENRIGILTMFLFLSSFLVKHLLGENTFYATLLLAIALGLYSAAKEAKKQ